MSRVLPRLLCRCFAGVAGWGILCLSAGGCASGAGREALPTPAPIPAIEDGLRQARAWSRTWAGQEDRLGDTVANMILVCRPGSPSTTGPARIVCRLVLLDREVVPIRANGSIRGILVALHETSGPEPLAAWALDPRQADACFRYGQLPGYLLVLERTHHVVADRYVLVVRWNSSDGRSRLTEKILFEGTFNHDQQTTTPPLGP